MEETLFQTVKEVTGQDSMEGDDPTAAVTKSLRRLYGLHLKLNTIWEHITIKNSGTYYLVCY
jgi:hypothetical protein